MSGKVYDAEQVDGILKAASETMHAVTAHAQDVETENTALKNEVAALKQAAAEKVELEKVASPAASTLNPEKVNQFINMLDARSLLPGGEQEKYAAACLKDGNNALDFCMRALQLSEAPASQGRGIKSASVDTPVQDELRQKEAEAWKRVADEFVR